MKNEIKTYSNWTRTFDIRQDVDKNDSIEAKDIDIFNIPIIKSITSYIEKNAYLKSLCGILIPIIAALYSTTITCWPQHDIILYPEYWYEPLAPTIVSYILISTPAQLIGCSLVMNVNFLLKIKNILIMILSETLGFLATYVLLHISWVQGVGYPHPMPFIGLLSWTIGSIMRMVAFWFLFPRSLRVKDKTFRKRVLAYFSFFPLNMFMAVGYSQLQSLFFVVPLKWQWCAGLLIPFVKKFNMWANAKLAFKAAGGESISARVVLICFVGSLHGLSISLLLSNVTSTTAYVVMLLDSLPNIWSMFSLVKLKKRDMGLRDPKLYDDFLCLTLKELFELLVPLVYTASFVIAYYGPNAEIFGNIKNDYWQYKKVDDLSEKLKVLGTFILIDAVRGSLFGIFLWITCKLNMFEAYCNIVIKYGLVIILQLIRVMNPYYGDLNVAYAADHTYQFSWLNNTQN